MFREMDKFEIYIKRFWTKNLILIIENEKKKKLYESSTFYAFTNQ